MTESRCCVLFSKPAEPGRVKTRLHGVLTPTQAAELHQAFLDDLVPRLDSGAFDLQIAWAVRNGENVPEGDVPSFRQRGSDLGSRLWQGLTRVARQYDAVAAVGSDHPELTAERVESAFVALEEGADVVIGPAEDGGYYLIGARAGSLPHDLFTDIPWSGANVFAVTLERCGELGFEPYLLPRGHDVDVPGDLDRLTSTIRAGTDTWPSIERVLRQWGRL